MENTYHAKVNGQAELKDIDLSQLDYVRSGEGQFHILKDNKSFHVELLKADPVAKQFTLKINGNVYEVQLSDRYDQLVEKLGLSATLAHKVREVKAPMPGLVLEINVAVGQEVRKGDPLLILEAMKMENILKSPGDGVVKSVHVSKGVAVEKGGLLIEME